MTLHVLSQQNTVLNKFIAQIRDREIQKDSMRFRRNMERIGEITAYEISKALHYRPQVVETPLGEATVQVIDDQLVIATILRAGLPYHQGFLNYFDDAQNAFVSAYRKSTKDGKFKVKVEYISCGSLEGKTLLLVDPMLATGSSLVLTYNALCEKGGTPACTHVAAVIASEQGVDYAMKHMPRQTTIWTAVVDEELTSRSYIVPGIGSHVQVGALDIQVALLVLQEEPRRKAVDHDADAGRPGNRPADDRLGVQHPTDTLGDDHPHGDQQDHRVEQRDQHRALFITIGIFRGGVRLRQPEGQHRQQQARHVREVVPRIGEQPHRAVPEPHGELHDDKTRIQGDSPQKGLVQRRHRRVMVVMMVMGMKFRFVCHGLLMIRAGFP